MGSRSSTDSDLGFERVVLTAKRVKWKEVIISEEDISLHWRTKDTYVSKTCETIDYYCAHSSSCSARLKKKSLPNGVVSFLINSAVHSNHRKVDYGLTPEQKALVHECYASGVTTPTGILMTFKSKQVSEPSKAQLNNFLQRHRRSLIKTNIDKDVGDLLVWAKNNSAIPSNCDTPFVVDCSVGDSSETNCHMRIFISTPRLLKFAWFFRHLHADATYKLVHQGYPVLIVGVTDMGKTFHPCGIAVCKRECDEDYEFLFRSLKTGVETVTKEEYKPTYLIADCADAITNGFVKVFGSNIKRVYCYVHVIAAIDKKLHLVKDAKQRKCLRYDITQLRQAATTEIFESAAALLMEKWKRQEPNFCEYFQKQWLLSKKTWYLGYVEHGIPTHNNALESTNRYIKDLYTKRKKRAVGEFLDNTTRIVSSWSSQRNGEGPNSIELQYRLSPDLPTLKKADAWLKTKPEIYVQNGKSSVAFVRHNGFLISASDHKKLASSKRIQKWKSFKDFVDSELHVHRISFEKNTYLLDYRCTCSDFLKSYFCMHVVSLAVIHNKFEMPSEAMTGGLGTKRGPGRPKKCSSALKKD